MKETNLKNQLQQIEQSVEKLDPRPKLSRFFRILGPGVITGAADDDPAGIGTYSQTGAQFGLGMAWLMFWVYPLMTAVQEACARIGAVKGAGLARVVKEHYNRPVLYSVVGLVVFANVFNIGADLGAMASATQLVVDLPFTTIILAYAILILGLVILTSYRTYVRLLKWLVLALLAYPLTALIVQQPWGEVARATLLPHFEFSYDFVFLITAVLGTTISPYLFFWQTSEVVEEEIAAHRLAQKGGIPRISRAFLRKLRIDNAIGMLFSNITAWFIIITAAGVLHANGVTEINSAADAAKALEPLVENFANAGLITKSIFATGIVGLGLLAVPVLAGSASYALSEVMGWNEGLYRKFKRARGFYTVITLATLAGLAMNFVGIDPIKALIYSAVLNGLAAVPLLYLIARISARRDIMGEYRSGKLSLGLIWVTFVLMAGAAGLLLVSLLR